MVNIFEELKFTAKIKQIDEIEDKCKNFVTYKVLGDIEREIEFKANSSDMKVIKDDLK